jgi:asparagine N-glycosylation enzyme membrane subunit Stt3
MAAPADSPREAWPSAPASVRARLGLWAATFGVAFAARLVSWPQVFVAGGIQPVGFDPYYHFRRILYTATRFPKSLDFDPYLNFPAGAKPIWSPPFDWLLGAMVRILHPDPSTVDVMRLTVWVPPALGALSVVAAAAIVHRCFGLRAALVTAFLAALLPGSVWYGQLGFVDHHVAVALGSTLAFGAVLRQWDHLHSGSRRALLVPTLVLGLLLGGLVILWPGSLIDVGLLELLLVGLLVAADPLTARRGAGSLAGAHALACAIVLPLCAGVQWPRWGSFTPVVLSDFQPWFFGVLALAYLACALAWREPRASGSGLRRLLGLGLAVGVALAVTAAVSAGFARGVRDALSWLFRSEAFQASVGESMSILHQGGQWALDTALETTSALFLLVPVLVAWVALRARTRVHLVLMAAWALAWWSILLLQARFVANFTLAESMLVGALFGLLARRAGAVRTPRGRLFWRLTGLAIAATLLYWPARFAAGAWELVWNGVDTTPSWVSDAIGVARWTAAETPATAGFFDPAVRPEYGVLTSLNLGHLFLYLARRPTVVGNFGDDIGEENYRFALRFPGLTEPEALADLERMRVRYVVASASPPPRVPQDRMAWLLSESLGAGKNHPALHGLRLVYESPPPARFAAPSWRVFERVDGARLAGTAPPGTVIEARLGLDLGGGRRSEYRVESVADAGGRFELRVPYSTEGAPPSVRPDSGYRLWCGGVLREVSVSEEEVRDGRMVSVPGC